MIKLEEYMELLLMYRLEFLSSTIVVDILDKDIVSFKTILSVIISFWGISILSTIYFYSSIGLGWGLLLKLSTEKKTWFISAIISVSLLSTN
jgi:hypothetical protein